VTRCRVTPAAYPDFDEASNLSVPIWPCSGGGLACHACHQARGAPLPHLFTLTRTLSGRDLRTELSGSPVRQSRKPGGTFSVPLSLEAPFRRPRLPLATLLLYGARTFLSPSRASDCLDHSLLSYLGFRSRAGVETRGGRQTLFSARRKQGL